MAEKKNRTGPGDLGLDLSHQGDGPLFKWLVACVLFGARISQDIAADAYRALDRDHIVTPDRLADADWQHVVDLLGEGHYKRYDESKARELIQLGVDVNERYGGKLSTLPVGVGTKKAVRERLQEFKGMGPTATDIFLREVPWP